MPPAGFEDRTSHRTGYASILLFSICYLVTFVPCAVCLVCINIDRMTRNRKQKGQLYKHNGSIFLRWYETRIIDGIEQRAQRAKKLGSTDDFPDWKRNRKLRDLRDEEMAAIRKADDGRARPDAVTVDSFWSQTDLGYLAWLRKNRRASTVDGYEDLWRKYLEPHFRGRTFSGYEAKHGTTFLDDLANNTDLGRRSIAHLRSLCSGIFKRAKIRGIIDVNPWREVESPETPKPEETTWYTLEEAENIVSALVERVDCQLVVALACFLGLRTGEIRGLKWEDFGAEWLHIRRAVVRGREGPTKTPESTADIPLVPQVLIPLELWRQKCGNPREGWVFMNQDGRTTDLRELQRSVIKPIVEKAGLTWKALRAGRRGAATALVALHGPLAAQMLLRHKNMSTTLAHYQKTDRKVLIDGMKKLGEATQKDPQ